MLVTQNTQDHIDSQSHAIIKAAPMVFFKQRLVVTALFVSLSRGSQPLSNSESASMLPLPALIFSQSAE